MNNHPTKLVDKDGEWPTDYHNQIIDWNFDQYGPHAVQILKSVSAMIDNWQGQQNSMSFEHGMRDGGAHQTANEASSMTFQFIDDALHSAVTVQTNYEKTGGKGFSDAAWTYFGIALHTATDMTSPEHKGWQAWNLYDAGNALNHITLEHRSATSDDLDSQEARYLANLAAANLWRRFQNMLADERAKEASCKQRPDDPECHNECTSKIEQRENPH